MEKYNLIVSSSPHVRSDDNTRSIMLDVCIALVFPLLIAIYFFGPRALTITAVSVISCVVFEYIACRVMGRPPAIKDLSAVVSGLLLAFCLPPAAPLWLPVVGTFFAIVIVKQLYGGLGKNFLNPALAARAFLFSWASDMTTWTAPMLKEKLHPFKSIDPIDTVSAATPLKALKDGLLPEADFWQLFRGETAGSIGEMSSVLIIFGGLYLIARKVITPRIPLWYIGTVAALTFIFPGGSITFGNWSEQATWMISHLLSGGLLLGAIFMATDYSTSPVTKRGQVLFGIGCGALTVFIRYFGGYPEGVCYSILIMNTTVWLLDKAGLPRRFGVPKMDRFRAHFRGKQKGDGES